MTTDYEKQGTDFLAKHETEMTVKFLYNGPYFEDEKESRDVYEVTLKRGTSDYTFKFGQSIANSGLTVKRNPRGRTVYDHEEVRRKGGRIVPSAYDILSALTKNDPGTFKDFCSDFGYDTDSRRAEKIYFAVQEEYSAIAKMFTAAERDEMSEIQ